MLVFVKYNLQLETRQKQREEKEDTYGLICLSNLESDDDWITEWEDPCLIKGNSWMDVDECFNLEQDHLSKKIKRISTCNSKVIFTILFYILVLTFYVSDLLYMI